MLALSPLVWAETPAGGTAPVPPVAVAPQQSVAPLVKRVLPAVVNISVTETGKADPMSDQLPEEFRNSPFDEMLRRFFDEQQQGNRNGQQFEWHQFGGGGSPMDGGRRSASPSAPASSSIPTATS